MGMRHTSRAAVLHRPVTDWRDGPVADLEHAQKLGALGVLSGTITHDFNNLLGVIGGNASLALTQLPADSPVRPLLDEIELAARHGADLTRQLRAYAGKSEFVIESVDLSELVRALQPLLRSVVSKRAVLTLALGSDIEPVQADSTQLRQIVLNLATNASEAISGESGTVTITTKGIRADRPYLAEFPASDSPLATGSYAVLEVSDTGGGMTPETAARVFEPFFSTKGVGRGLGLAALEGIVRRHRGAIKVASRSGVGSVFTVILPSCATKQAGG